ncbi:MAG: hypothetical protein KIS94_02960 [Chitinophagales bacterium]|nr:hypothetical protein [Chitinophagales bacterium]
MRFLLLLLCWFVALSTTAQVVEVGTPTKLSSKTGKFKIIGKNNDGIIVRLYGTEDVIHVYSDDLKLAASKMLSFKNQDGLLQHIMLNKTGAVVFYLSQNKQFSVLFAQPVNSKFVEIGTPTAIDTIYDRKDLVASNLRFKSSADQNFLFIYYPYFEGSTVQYIRYQCLDRTLHKLYTRNVPIDRKEKELENSEAMVDNEGNAAIILKPERSGNTEEFDVFRVSATGELNVYSILTQKPLFGQAAFETDNKNGNLILCYFYNDGTQNEEAAAHGFFYGSYNPATGEKLSSVYFPFPSTFINELTGREMNNKNRLYTFNIKKTILRNDGGALIIAESFIKDTREIAVPLGIQPGFNNYRSSTIYQYNDIIAFSFNAAAQMEWYNIMRKKQASEDDNGVFSSFLIMNEKDKLRFVYLDDISASGALSQYTLSSEGKSQRQSLFNQEDRDLLLLPKLGRQISPAEAVIPSYKNGALQLIKLIF